MKPPTEDILEAQIRKVFLNRYRGFWSRVEMAHGGTNGFPDSLVLDATGFLAPVEFKRGWLVHGKLQVDDIRPAQVSWHTRFTEAGGRAAFIIGARPFPDQPIMMFIARSANVIAARFTGIEAPSEVCRLLPLSDNFTKTVQNFL